MLFTNFLLFCLGNLSRVRRTGRIEEFLTVTFKKKILKWDGEMAQWVVCLL